MSKNSLSLKIAHICPDILQGFGDEINVKAFYMRSKWRDIDIQVNKIHINEKIQYPKYDFYYIGGSNTTNLDLALKYLVQNKDALKNAFLSKIPMLAINCGYILFGNDYKLNNSSAQEAMGFFNISSFEENNCTEEYVKGRCPFLDDTDVVGFKKHNFTTVLEETARPFLNLDNKKTEGARVYNAIGSFITSPLLAQNPLVCDFLISQALSVKYKDIFKLERLYDDVEFYSHNYILETK